MHSVNNELVKAGHDFAAAISNDTPIIEIAKIVSRLAAQLGVTTLALREKSHELTAYEATVTNLTAQVQGLAAENAQLKEIFDSVTNLENEPQYHDSGMGCGLEDRGITDRYEAMRHGWDEAMERVYGEVIPSAEEFEFKATDAALAEIRNEARAEGINFAAGRLAAAFNNGFIDKPLTEVLDVTRMILTAKEDIANEPAADGLSGEYAETALKEWAEKLRKEQGK